MKFKALIKKILENIDGVMFDKGLTCNLCGREVFHREDFCKDCLDTIDFNDGPICSCCGRKTPIATKRCDSCKGEWAVDLARSAFTYRGGAEGLIKALKYGGKQYLAEVLAPYLKQVYVENYFAPDFITFVPMTDEAIQKRGFNQAYLLARELAKITDNRCIEALLKKKETTQQEQLSAKERQINLEKCFAVTNKWEVFGKLVLLVDDVLTTGATAHACAKALKEAGAKSVYLLTVASVVKRIG